MGLLKHLLFWPVTGPSFLTRFAIETVQDTVRTELTDDQKIKEDLLALQMELELGDIDDAEYLVREAEIMLRKNWAALGTCTGGGSSSTRLCTQVGASAASCRATAPL